MHENEEALSMWAPDVPPVDPRTAARYFAVAFTGFLAFGATAYYGITPSLRAVRREYPYDGLVAELGGVDANKVRLPCSPGLPFRSLFHVQARVEAAAAEDDE
jgi:NADH dehydrogenase (ubiquinone) 1 beta subcomplex subunit 8